MITCLLCTLVGLEAADRSTKAVNPRIGDNGRLLDIVHEYIKQGTSVHGYFGVNMDTMVNRSILLQYLLLY